MNSENKTPEIKFCVQKVSNHRELLIKDMGQQIIST